MLYTRLTRDYGLDVPFVSAGMGLIALPELAASVSEAGGLGLLAAAVTPPSALREMIHKMRSLTSRPFGVDLVVTDTAFGQSTTVEHIRTCIEQRVPVVVFFWNLPPADWMRQLRESGIKVWIQVGSVSRAIEAARIGADAIIVQGSEAGGHNHSETGLIT